MMGYAEEHETTVLELTYNYGVTEYTKGNAYAQVRLPSEYIPSSKCLVKLSHYLTLCYPLLITVVLVPDCYQH